MRVSINMLLPKDPVEFFPCDLIQVSDEDVTLYETLSPPVTLCFISCRVVFEHDWGHGWTGHSYTATATLSGQHKACCSAEFPQNSAMRHLPTQPTQPP